MSQILVTRSSMPPIEEYVDEISSLWETHWLTNMGEKHQALEKALQNFLEVNNVTLYTNGHSALECAFEALQLGHDGRKKVITTPFTFASTTHAIVRKGLVPVFADIKAEDYTIDPSSIEKLVDEDTCAIVPVHVYGNICDVESIQKIANKYNLKVIYDGAHAFGVKVNGRSVANFGDLTMFSFHATKVFNTIEGGALCFKDPSLKNVLNQWKNFGITGPETTEYIGGNAKMNEFCAAMGLCNLRHINEEIKKRRTIAERYWEELQGVKGIKLSIPPDNVKYNYAYLPITVTDEYGMTRDDIFDALAKEDIHARKYFYPLTSNFECYAGRFDSGLTPIAQDIAARILTLPMYADLATEDVDRICKIIVRALH